MPALRARAAVGGCLLALVASEARAAATEPSDPSAPARRECEALTAQGRRSDAVLACSRALETTHSAVNVRALVRALVDGPTPPTATELSLALGVIRVEHDRGGAATAAAAAADVAERMGDMVMLERCVDELRETAPDDPAVREAEAVLAARCPPWRFWGGWLLVAAAVAGTLGHAGRRFVRGRRRRTAVPAAAALGAALVLAPSARADDPGVPQHGWLSKWPVDDQHPEASIPPEKERNADPLQFGYWLQDLAWKAERSSRRGDHTAAVRYYHALAVAVPDRAVGFVKTCEEYEALGDRDQAIENCGQALLRDGLTVGDYGHFVRLVLAKPGPLAEKDSAALTQVLQHMREDPAGRDAVDDLECQVGTRTSNVAQLEECTRGLQARAPDDPRTVSYLWALAVAKGDHAAASALVDRAKAAGIAPADVQRMSDATAKNAMAGRVRTVLFALTFALLFAAMAVGGRAFVMRRRLSASR
jgi:hypothetical protein